MGFIKIKYVKVKKFSELTGYTEDATRKKIQSGVWMEGIHYRHAPNNRIQMDMDAYTDWVEGEKLTTAMKKAAIQAA